MSTRSGIYKDGVIQPDQPLDLPDGAVVEFSYLRPAAPSAKGVMEEAVAYELTSPANAPELAPAEAIAAVEARFPGIFSSRRTPEESAKMLADIEEQFGRIDENEWR